LLLLDEPFTGLDETASRALSSVLGDFTRAGGTVLMSTHEIERGFGVATRVVILERGAVTFDRPTAETDVSQFRHAYWHGLFTGAPRS
jgi:ABC-type multidrug transport system ATPase subunit